MRILSIKSLLLGLLSLLLLPLLGAAPAPAQEHEPNLLVALPSPVRDFFARVPLTLFENTPEGMSDNERVELLESGASAFWHITDETELTLSLKSIPFGESEVSVRLFPQKSQVGGQDFVLAALGSRSTAMCTIEMWHEDRNGRMVPEDTPQEPPISDFFAPQSRIPKDVEPSVLICLGAEGLEAMPIFWNASGMAYIPVDNTVTYAWTGAAFEKQIRPKVRP